MPAVALAVNTGAVAMPEALVTAVTVVRFPGNVPLAPDDGAVNVTVAPCTGPFISVTVALNAVPNGALTSAICGVPAVAEIEVLSKMSVTGILNGLLAAPAEVMMTFPLKVVAARLVVTTETVIV